MTDFAAYITKPNDRLDLIAGLYYGDCFKIQPIYDANSWLDMNKPVLDEGLTLVIPLPEGEMNDKQNSKLPIWKRK